MEHALEILGGYIFAPCEGINKCSICQKEIKQVVEHMREKCKVKLTPKQYTEIAKFCVEYNREVLEKIERMTDATTG